MAFIGIMMMLIAKIDATVKEVFLEKDKYLLI